MHLNLSSQFCSLTWSILVQGFDEEAELRDRMSKPAPPSVTYKMFAFAFKRDVNGRTGEAL